MSDLDIQKKMKKSMDKTIFVDCAILNHDYFLVMAELDMGVDYAPWKELPPSKIFAYIQESPPENSYWGGHIFGKNVFKWPRIAHTEPNEMLVIGERGEVWYHGLGDNKQFEESIPKKLIIGVYGIKNIHGTIYVIGTNRTVLRREGPDKWTPISQVIKKISIETYRKIDKKGGIFSPGFNCIDGFSAHKDLYAGGGDGDVWRYDGQDWHPIDIPLPKMQINALCCASDGQVYIVGRFGTLLKGREDHWHTISTDISGDFKDIVDYQGTLYLCTERKLYQIDGESIKPVDFGEMKTPFSFKSLYVNHGKMMTAGSYDACIFDGKQWQSLYGSSKAEEITDLNILKKLGEDMEDAMDDLSEIIDKVENPKPE